MSRTKAHLAAWLLGVLPWSGSVLAQCTDYDIIVGGGSAPGQMHWELMDQFGNIIASGDAPETTGECLDDGCYTMIMYDDGNNGWQGGTWTINYENTSIVVASGTLASGGYGTAQIDLNGGCGTGGCQDFLIDVTAGSSPNDVYWELTDEFGNLLLSGGAPDAQVICLTDGCYFLYLYDAGGDGWQGGDYTITELASGNIISQGTLASGAFGSSQVIIGAGCGSCDLYDLTVTSGSNPADISWDMYDDMGNFIAAGGAPTTQALCLGNGCYTFYAYDNGNNGWEGAAFSIVSSSNGSTVGSGTLIAGGYGSYQVSIGGGCGTCSSYSMVVTSGSAPQEVSWSFSNMGTVYGSGWAPSTQSMCLDTGCYVLNMHDTGGNGWNGATWTLLNGSGGTVQSGTLASGSTGAVAISIGASTPCEVPIVVTASDCPQAVNVCTNLNFTIEPNGWGAIWEVPALGSTSNPEFWWGDGIMSPWGTDHYGCLMGQEINTTWMIVNIAQGGSLEFTLGANGAQAGYYDWIMYPYSPTACGQVLANTLAPVRCNWNYASTGGTGITSAVPAGGFPENYEPPLNVLTGQQYLICFSNWSSVTTVVPLVFGGTAVVSCLPLPVELISFDAWVNEGAIQTSWTTASEVNISRFVVQRSFDSEHWEAAGVVAAWGNSTTPHAYALRDEHPFDDASYYRLVTVDQDGQTSLSPNVMVNLLAEEMLCHPNPTTGITYIDQLSEASRLEVLNHLGAPAPFHLDAPQYGVLRVDLTGNPPGVYVIRVLGGKQARTSRVILLGE